MRKFTRYVIKKIIYMVIILYIILTLIFLLFEALPLKAHELLKLNPQIEPSQIEYMEKLYGYDRPIHERYVKFLRNMVLLEGISFHYLLPVKDLIFERLPRTLLLVGGATIIAYGIGIIAGALIAWRRGRFVDKGTVVSTLIFYNMPSFWLGLIFIYIFAAKFGLFPLGGFMDPEAKLPEFVNILWHTALPMSVLTILHLAGTILLMRTSMLDVMGEPFITTAIAKGLSERDVLYKHATRTALLPIVSSFILSLVFSVGGALITEQVFSYQGIGQLFIQSLHQLDYAVCQTTTFVISLLVIIGYFLGDVIYGWLDPRVGSR